MPIREHLKLPSTHVLTINHVFDILLTYNLTRDWTSTLEKVLPQRKAAVAPTVVPSPSLLTLLPPTGTEAQSQEEEVTLVSSAESLPSLHATDVMHLKEAVHVVVEEKKEHDTTNAVLTISGSIDT